MKLSTAKKRLLHHFGKAPYHVKKHDTQRKVVAKIKHEICVNHGVTNADDGDTRVPKVDKNYNDDFVVG